MENAIHVGNKVDKETGQNLKEIIETIFRVGVVGAIRRRLELLVGRGDYLW